MTKPESIYNPITAMQFPKCLPFSWTTPIAAMGVVDPTLGPSVIAWPAVSKYGIVASRSTYQLVTSHVTN